MNLKETQTQDAALVQAPDVGTRFRMFMTTSDIFEDEVAVSTVTLPLGYRETVHLNGKRSI